MYYKFIEVMVSGTSIVCATFLVSGTCIVLYFLWAIEQNSFRNYNEFRGLASSLLDVQLFFFHGDIQIFSVCHTLLILITDNVVEIYVKSWSHKKAIACSTVFSFQGDIQILCVILCRYC